VKVLLYKPGCEPAIKFIAPTLEAMQDVVGGYIETVRLTDNLVLVCDEEGKLKDKPANRVLYKDGRRPIDVLVGDFFICRSVGEEFGSIKPGDEDLAGLFLAPA